MMAQREGYSHVQKAAGTWMRREFCQGSPGLCFSHFWPDYLPTQHSMDPNAENPVLLMLAESISVIFQHVVMYKTAFPESSS